MANVFRRVIRVRIDRATAGPRREQVDDLKLNMTNDRSDSVALFGPQDGEKYAMRPIKSFPTAFLTPCAICSTVLPSRPQ